MDTTTTLPARNSQIRNTSGYERVVRLIIISPPFSPESSPDLVLRRQKFAGQLTYSRLDNCRIPRKAQDHGSNDASGEEDAPIVWSGDTLWRPRGTPEAAALLKRELICTSPPCKNYAKTQPAAPIPLPGLRLGPANYRYRKSLLQRYNFAFHNSPTSIDIDLMARSRGMYPVTSLPVHRVPCGKYSRGTVAVGLPPSPTSLGLSTAQGAR